MFIIVGLGNPTLRYEGTRHNVGFDVIDRLADKYNITVETHKNRACIGKGMIGGHKVILVKPQTYMNLSGESVRAITDYYKIDPESELLVIYDDKSLAVGQLRIRRKGSAGGHNGVKNIILHMDTDVFARIKVGIGETPDGYDLVNYVLGHFSGEDRKLMEEAYGRAVQAVEMILGGDVDGAMNEFNKKPQKEKKSRAKNRPQKKEGTGATESLQAQSEANAAERPQAQGETNAAEDLREKEETVAAKSPQKKEEADMAREKEA